MKSKLLIIPKIFLVCFLSLVNPQKYANWAQPDKNSSQWDSDSDTENDITSILLHSVKHLVCRLVINLWNVYWSSKSFQHRLKAPLSDQRWTFLAAKAAVEFTLLVCLLVCLLLTQNMSKFWHNPYLTHLVGLRDFLKISESGT